MAASLQSFQSNDKQMQAIRELTNEIYALKLQGSNTESHLSQLDQSIDDIYDELTLVNKRSLIRQAFTVSAGSNSGQYPITIGSIPEGYRVVGAIPQVVFDSNQAASLNLICTYCNATANNTITFALFNPTSADIDSVGISALLLFKKIVS